MSRDAEVAAKPVPRSARHRRLLREQLLLEIAQWLASEIDLKPMTKDQERDMVEFQQRIYEVMDHPSTSYLRLINKWVKEIEEEIASRELKDDATV